MDNRRLIDADRFLEWIEGQAQKYYWETEGNVYSHIAGLVKDGEFDPDPIPPTIKRGDKVDSEHIRSLEYAENFALEQTKLVLEVEAREKKLHEAIKEALSWTWNCGENNMTEVIAILRGVLASLYPEKEGEA